MGTMEYNMMKWTIELGKTNNATYQNPGQACDYIFHSATHPEKFTRLNWSFAPVLIGILFVCIDRDLRANTSNQHEDGITYQNQKDIRS